MTAVSENRPAPENRKEAANITIARNAALAESLNWDDQESFPNAARGFLATWDPLTITAGDSLIWTLIPRPTRTDRP